MMKQMQGKLGRISVLKYSKAHAYPQRVTMTAFDLSHRTFVRNTGRRNSGGQRNNWIIVGRKG